MGFVARYAKGTDNVVSPSKHHIAKGRGFLVWNGWARYLQWLPLDLTHSFDLNGYAPAQPAEEQLHKEL